MTQPEWYYPDRENLTWEVFGEASRHLSQEIVDSGWFPPPPHGHAQSPRAKPAITVDPVQWS